MKKTILVASLAIIIGVIGCKKKEVETPVSTTSSPTVYTTEMKKNDTPLSGTIFQEYRTLNSLGYDREIITTLQEGSKKHIMHAYYKDSSAVNGTKLWSPYLTDVAGNIKNCNTMSFSYSYDNGSGIFQEYKTKNNGKKATIQKRYDADDIIIQVYGLRMQNITLAGDSPVWDLTLRYKL